MDAIRSIVQQYGGLALPVSEVAGDDDLYRLGLTSRSQVTVMLAVEDHFDVEFTREYTTRATFSSLNSIASGLRASAAAVGVDLESASL